MCLLASFGSYETKTCQVIRANKTILAHQSDIMRECLANRTILTHQSGTMREGFSYSLLRECWIAVS